MEEVRRPTRELRFLPHEVGCRALMYADAEGHRKETPTFGETTMGWPVRRKREQLVCNCARQVLTERLEAALRSPYPREIISLLKELNG